LLLNVYSVAVGRSVGIVRSRTKGHGVLFCFSVAVLLHPYLLQFLIPCKVFPVFVYSANYILDHNYLLNLFICELQVCDNFYSIIMFLLHVCVAWTWIGCAFLLFLCIAFIFHNFWFLSFIMLVQMGCPLFMFCENVRYISELVCLFLYDTFTSFLFLCNTNIVNVIIRAVIL
jgi:hypothetical protein